MSRESHRAYLERAALKAAQRAIDRKGGGKLTELQARGLKVQTIEPWKRLLIALLGAGLATLSYLSIANDQVTLGVVLAIGSVGLFLIALVGRRRHADAVFDGIDLLEILDAML